MVVLAGADWQGVEYYDANKGFSAIQNAFVNPFASAGIMDFWEKRSASQSRMSANYSEAVRGVNTYTTPSGGTVECSVTADHVYQNRYGDTIGVSGNAVDPDVAAKLNWTKLEKK